MPKLANRFDPLTPLVIANRRLLKAKAFVKPNKLVNACDKLVNAYGGRLLAKFESALIRRRSSSDKPIMFVPGAGGAVRVCGFGGRWSGGASRWIWASEVNPPVARMIAIQIAFIKLWHKHSLRAENS